MYRAMGSVRFQWSRGRCLGFRLHRFLLLAFVFLAADASLGIEQRAYLLRDESTFPLPTEAAARRPAEPVGALPSASTSGQHLRPTSVRADAVTGPDVGGPNRRSLLSHGGGVSQASSSVCPGGPGSTPLDAATLKKRGFFLPHVNATVPDQTAKQGCWRRAPCLCESAILAGDWRENCASGLRAEDWTDLDLPAGATPASEAAAAPLLAHASGLKALAKLLAGRRTAFVGDSVSQQFFVFLR